MANPVQLSYEMHHRLRVITARGAEFGENVHIVPVIADEMVRLVLEYAVCLIKDPETGQFNLSVLLGFEPGENLYLNGDQWDASYVPLHVRRQPFMVGYASATAGDGEPGQAVVTVDLDSKRVQQSEGELLFREDGSNTPFLDDINKLLAALMSGIDSTKAFIDALADNDLIEAAQIKITFADGEQKSYDGIYTVNDEKLAELKGDALQDMHARGFLQASSLLMVSLGHVTNLISRKNARHAAAA